MGTFLIQHLESQKNVSHFMFEQALQKHRSMEIIANSIVRLQYITENEESQQIYNRF